MKERPILFSAPMVRAILGGTKTQTRRVVKWAKWLSAEGVEQAVMSHRSGGDLSAWGWFVKDGQLVDHTTPGARRVSQGCPYGRPGNRLWVRETWAYNGQANSNYGPVDARRPALGSRRRAGRARGCQRRGVGAACDAAAARVARGA